METKTLHSVVRRWTDDDMYEAYLKGCEDMADDSPINKETFLATLDDIEDVE